MENTNNNPTNPPLQKAQEVAEEMKREAGRYVDSAKDHWDEFSNDLKEKGKIAREGMRKAGAYADNYVHENPWKVIGIAAGIGALAALLLSNCGSRRSCRRHHHEE